MALKKKSILPSGVSVEYWRLAKLFVDPTAPRVEVTFDGYVNQAARVDGKTPVPDASFGHAFTGEDAQTLLAGNEFPVKAAVYPLAVAAADTAPDESPLARLRNATDC